MIILSINCDLLLHSCSHAQNFIYIYRIDKGDFANFFHFFLFYFLKKAIVPHPPGQLSVLVIQRAKYNNLRIKVNEGTINVFFSFFFTSFNKVEAERENKKNIE
jgi:hypothetical protein